MLLLAGTFGPVPAVGRSMVREREGWFEERRLRPPLPPVPPVLERKLSAYNPVEPELVRADVECECRVLEIERRERDRGRDREVAARIEEEAEEAKSRNENSVSRVGEPVVGRVCLGRSAVVVVVVVAVAGFSTSSKARSKSLVSVSEKPRSGENDERSRVFVAVPRSLELRVRLNDRVAFRQFLSILRFVASLEGATNKPKVFSRSRVSETLVFSCSCS